VRVVVFANGSTYRSTSLSQALEACFAIVSMSSGPAELCLRGGGGGAHKVRMLEFAGSAGRSAWVWVALREDSLVPISADVISCEASQPHTNYVLISSVTL
jgi:hypothetical protein